MENPLQNLNLSKPQLIALGIIAAIILILVGIFAGVLPGLKTKTAPPPQMNLVIWGVNDENNAFENNLFAYSKIHPNISITYKKMDASTYEQDLVNAMAAGNGPDIFMVNNSWIPKHFDIMYPIPSAQLSLTQLRDLFPSVVEEDFVWKNSIYALPLYIDSLALFYNQDLFDNYAIALPPKDWLAFQNLIPKLRQLDSNGNLVRAGAAIGGSEVSMHNAADILSLLMLQAGAQMTNKDFTQATFVSSVQSGQPGIQSVNFYTSFADPTSLYYTWNDSMPYSTDAFAQGKTAMIFEYASQIDALKAKNPLLRIGISPMPQPTGGQQAVNYANYEGLAVSKYTKYPDWVWDVVSYLTTDTTAATNYLEATNHPPALRTLIKQYSDDPDIGVFAKQALTAESWLKPDPEQTRQIFSQLIQAVVSKKLDTYQALSQAERSVSDLIQKIQ